MKRRWPPRTSESGPLTVWEKDQQFVDYLETKRHTIEKAPEADMETREWLMIERILRTGLSSRLIDHQLGYLDTSLADLIPKGYNTDKLPETATA